MPLTTNGSLWNFTFSPSVVGTHEEIQENFIREVFLEEFVFHLPTKTFKFFLVVQPHPISGRLPRERAARSITFQDTRAE